MCTCKTIGYRLRFANGGRVTWYPPSHGEAARVASKAKLFSTKQEAEQCRKTLNDTWREFSRVVRVVKRDKP